VAKRGDGRHSRTRRAGRGRWRWLVVAAALLAAPASPQTKATPAGAQPRPIALVGLDGGDWLAIDRLVARGELPSFARLKARGRTGLMRATPPLVSPILWTTIATGRRPEDHRVLDFMVDLPGGGLAPVTSSERRVAALWNLFSERERTVAVVGWLATWPAESVRGTIVTDRVASRLAETGAAPDPLAWSPASRAAELARLLVRPQQLTREDLAGYAALTEDELAQVRQALASPPAALYKNPLAHLALTVAGGRSHERLAEALVKPKQPDLLMVYLDGVDALSHRFVRDAKRGPTVIDEAYRDADAFLARLAATLRPETWILVTSDHGFYPKDAGVADDLAELAGPASAWHRPYGIVAAIEARELRAIASPGTPTPRDVGTVTALDVAPTLLHAAGLAPSVEMPGRVVDTLLPPEAAARPVVRARSLEAPQRAAAPAQADTADPAGRERLAALGYVAAGALSLGRQNLGEILYRKGDYTGAERELRAVVADQPHNVPALLWLARSVAAQERPPAALELFERALAVEPAGDVLLEAVELATRSGSSATARRLLGRFPPRSETRACAAVARAVLAASEAQPRQAESELRAALAADATHVGALERLLDLLRGSGRAREAVAPLRRAAELAPDSARIQALLGSALLASGDAAGAEAPLARAQQLAPDAASVSLELARVDLARDRVAEARARLARLPASRERSVLLGVAAARAGAWEEAARHYRDAAAASPLDKELLNALGFALYKSGRASEAAEQLDRSLAIDAAQPEIRRLRAELPGPGGS
jgi:tetratricopeptide (TPR) repeat protein